MHDNVTIQSRSQFNDHCKHKQALLSQNFILTKMFRSNSEERKITRNEKKPLRADHFIHESYMNSL